MCYFYGDTQKTKRKNKHLTLAFRCVVFIAFTIKLLSNIYIFCLFGFCFTLLCRYNVSVTTLIIYTVKKNIFSLFSSQKNNNSNVFIGISSRYPIVFKSSSLTFSLSKDRLSTHRSQYRDG